jgi:hypothetical protein
MQARLRIAAALWLALFAGAAAAAPKLKPVKDDVVLEAGEALLAVVLGEQSLGVEWLVLHDEGGRAIAQLKLGSKGGKYDYLLFVVPAGRYAVRAVRVPDARRQPFELADTPYATFEAGKINYVGDYAFSYDREGLDVAVRDRTGRLMTELREHKSALHARYPVVYVGEGDGDWSRSIAR